MAAKVDAVIEKAKAAEGPQGFALYSRFGLAGAVGCSVTHGALTPVDVYVLPVFFIVYWSWASGRLAHPKRAFVQLSTTSAVQF